MTSCGVVFSSPQSDVRGRHLSIVDTNDTGDSATISSNASGTIIKTNGVHITTTQTGISLSTTDKSAFITIDPSGVVLSTVDKPVQLSSLNSSTGITTVFKADAKSNTTSIANYQGTSTVPIESKSGDTPILSVLGNVSVTGTINSTGNVNGGTGGGGGTTVITDSSITYIDVSLLDSKVNIITITSLNTVIDFSKVTTKNGYSINLISLGSTTSLVSITIVNLRSTLFTHSNLTPITCNASGGSTIFMEGNPNPVSSISLLQNTRTQFMWMGYTSGSGIVPTWLVVPVTYMTGSSYTLKILRSSSP